jgi:hypothetical protein
METEVKIDATEEAFTAAMRAAVAERGEDYVYPREERGYACVYTFNGEPDCLIGLALFKMGVPITFLQDCDGMNNALGVLLDLGFSRYVADAADWAQSLQDKGHTWGESLGGYFQMLEGEV